MIYNVSSSTIFSITSDPVDALVTTQPTKTFLPNLGAKILSVALSFRHCYLLCDMTCYLLCDMTLQHPRSSMRKPNNLYFSSVSIIVVAEWPEK